MDIVVGVSVDVGTRKRALLLLGDLLRSRSSFLFFLETQGSPDGDADKSFLFILVRQLCRTSPPLVADLPVGSGAFSVAAAAALGESSALLPDPLGVCAGPDLNASFSSETFAEAASGGGGSVGGAVGSSSGADAWRQGQQSQAQALALLQYRLEVVKLLMGLLDQHGSLAVAPLLGVPFRVLDVAGAEGAGGGAQQAGAGNRGGRKRRALSDAASPLLPLPLQPQQQHQQQPARVLLHPDECFDTAAYDPHLLDVECINRLASLWVQLIRSLDLAPPQLSPDSEEHGASLIVIELTKLLNGFARRMKFGQWPSLVSNLLETINATLARWGPEGTHGYFHPSLACLESHLDCLDYLSYGTAEMTFTNLS